jgi:hypothetical protein
MTDFWNWYTLAVFVACVVVVLRYFTKTRVNGIFVLMLAYVWTVVIRFGISLNLGWLERNSRPLTAITATLHLAGLILLLWALNKFYSGGRAHTVDEREQRADEREHVADIREYEQDNRERVADVRDEAADKREGENDG